MPDWLLPPLFCPDAPSAVSTNLGVQLIQRYTIHQDVPSMHIVKLHQHAGYGGLAAAAADRDKSQETVSFRLG